MLKVVADTNTLISAFIAEGNEYNLLKQAKLGRIKLITTLQILKEFKGVISRPKFGFSKEQREAVTKQVISLSEVIAPTEKIKVIKEDAADNKVLEAAVSGKADCIVSGDKHLLQLKEFGGIKIVRTHEILNKLQKL